MSIHYIDSSEQVARSLATLIVKPLSDGKKVLWLISGGSSLSISVRAATSLRDAKPKNLSISLVDDVFGVDERETNWYKLHQLGFCLEQAQVHPIRELNLSLAETGEAFDEYLHEQLRKVDFAIGQFGIGEAFHTGGILPQSIAARENDKLALGYKVASVQRVTVTPALIAKLDVAFINSMGEKKREMVTHFRSSNANVLDEPTQALKLAKQTLLYSDVLD